MTLLIFTDLDGTLMEHESYSIDAARPALELLKERGLVPVINSSKTQAEITCIQHRLQLDGPYICENGAVLCNFDDAHGEQTTRSFGKPLMAWLDKVHEIRRERNFAFEGFNDWSDAQVADMTGLSVEEARRAKLRQFSEPILWRDTNSALRRFIEALGLLELQIIEGGRFLSVQGNFSKSTAMTWLRDQTQDQNRHVVALGDSPNDTSMLDVADIAVIIKSAKSDQIHLKHPTHIIRTKRPGPAGWHDAIVEILDMMDSGKLTQAKGHHHG